MYLRIILIVFFLLFVVGIYSIIVRDWGNGDVAESESELGSLQANNNSEVSSRRVVSNGLERNSRPGPKVREGLATFRDMIEEIDDPNYDFEELIRHAAKHLSFEGASVIASDYCSFLKTLIRKKSHLMSPELLLKLVENYDLHYSANSKHIDPGSLMSAVKANVYYSLSLVDPDKLLLVRDLITDSLGEFHRIEKEYTVGLIARKDFGSLLLRVENHDNLRGKLVMIWSVGMGYFNTSMVEGAIQEGDLERFSRDELVQFIDLSEGVKAYLSSLSEAEREAELSVEQYTGFDSKNKIYGRSYTTNPPDRAQSRASSVNMRRFEETLNQSKELLNIIDSREEDTR